MTKRDAMDASGNPLLDWETLDYTRAEIARVEQRLRELYRHRRQGAIEMRAAGMSLREIGEHWRLSGSRIGAIITEYRRPKQYR